MIYASALFAFYFFITAIVNLVRFRGNKNPILTASKNLAFAGASMSILALQTAMISTFSEGERDFIRTIKDEYVSKLKIRKVTE